MTIDIIITTYNRANRIQFLINQLHHIKGVNYIIIIDSSDIENKSLKNKNSIIYHHTIHKNQPYQRYLGYSLSKSEILIFFDDDMEIIDYDFIKKTIEIYKKQDIVGIAYKFIDKSSNSSLSMIPQSKLFRKFKLIKQFKNWFTGMPNLAQGKFGLCGNRGIQPLGSGFTEWLSGGAFSALKSVLFVNFNFQLFDIFEEKLGMGEDAIIGYGLSKIGKLYYHDELFFYHNDQKDSNYSVNIKTYAKRVAFSRYFLSKEKIRLDKRNTLVLFHYSWYILWRFLGYFANLLISINKKRFDFLVGFVEGYKKVLLYKFKSINITKSFWISEIENEIKKTNEK
jgi:glycosyltransferase involved in cell wall biosynthesis